MIARHASLLLLCCALVQLPAIASELEEIVVTATRSEVLLRESPFDTSLVSRDDLKTGIHDQLAESLRKLPGILVTDSGQAGQKRIRIRGEEARRVALLIDGQEFGDHRDVGVPVLADINRIERIEIVKGPASVLYGPRAMGGVINIITRGDTSPPPVAAKVQYDTSTKGYLTSVHLAQSNDTLTATAGASVNRQDLRDTPVGELENTAYESDAFNVSLAWTQDKHDWYVGYEDFDSTSDVFVEEAVRFSPPFRDFSIEAPQRDRRKFRLDYDWTPETEMLTRLSLDAYRQTSERDFITFPQLTLAPGLNVDTRIQTLSELTSDGFNLQADLFTGESTAVITGYQWVRDEVDQDRFRTVFTNDVQTSSTVQADAAELDTHALFAQVEARTKHWTVYAGARTYQVDGQLNSSTLVTAVAPFDDRHTVASIAAVYSHDGNVFRASYSEGYIFPSLLNLAMGAFAGSTYVNPDPGLKPETSRTFELGYRADLWALAIDTTLFLTRAEDYIDHQPCVAGDPCLSSRDRVYRNTGKADTHGLDLSLSWDVGPLTYDASVSWLRRHKQYEQADTWKAGVPELSGMIAARHSTQWKSKPLHCELSARFEAGVEELIVGTRGARVETHPGYVVFDVALSYEPVPAVDVGLVIANLADREYRSATENLFAPGRHLRITAAWNW